MAFTAFAIEWSEPSEAGDLFARESSDLRHTDEDSQRGALSDALDTLDQRQATGEVFVGPHGLYECPYLDASKLLESGDLGGDEFPLAILSESFGTSLGAGKIVFNLFEPGELLGECREPRLMYDRGLGIMRTSGDHSGIDLVILGPLQAIASIAAHLCRLEACDGNPLCMQMFDNRCFIATAGLNPGMDVQRVPGRNSPYRISPRPLLYPIQFLSMHCRIGRWDNVDAIDAVQAQFDAAREKLNPAEFG